jgi:hypothetical protein
VLTLMLSCRYRNASTEVGERQAPIVCRVQQIMRMQLHSRAERGMS